MLNSNPPGRQGAPVSPPSRPFRRSLVGLAACALCALLPVSARALVITEIMYNPNETPDERPFEFLELYNEHSDPLDLSGYQICNGVIFELPPGTWLDGHSFIVVCANEANIQAKYGITNTVGDWFTNPTTSPSLSNGGERVEVCNPGGRTVVTARYNDRGQWPGGADGTGHSLEIVSPYLEVDDPDSWVLSNDIGGSPGGINPCWTGDALAGAPSGGGGGGPVGTFTEHLDVGFPCTPGDTTFNSSLGRYTVTGSGNDIWSGGDQFHYAYVKVNGNFNMQARIVSYDRDTAPSQWGKVGIMARQDLSPSSRYAFVHDSPNPDSTRMAIRPTHGGSDNAEPFVLPNGTHATWLRLGRVGNTITGYHSANGTTWTTFGTMDWQGGAIVHLGFANTSHAGCPTAPIVFDQLTITGTILPPDDPGPGPGPGETPECIPRTRVRLNEAYLRTNGGEERWIELYNPGTSDFNLGGYKLTNSAANLDLFTIPGGTMIEDKGFLVFSESELGFSLEAAEPGEIGDRVFIALVEPAPRSRVVDAFNFEPLHVGYSEARIGADDQEFTQGADPTPGDPNVTSVITDIVINEVMYHPIDNDNRKEWIELHNRGAAGQDLTGYTLSDGVNFAFPPGTSIPAGGWLVVAREPELIRSIYGLDSTQVVGPEDTQEARDAYGLLRDGGERITLTDFFGRTVDTVRFHDGGEWPRWPDGLGSSLELIDASHDNRRGMAWDASDDSGKASTQTFSYIARHGNRETELAIALMQRGITLVDDFSVMSGSAGVNDTNLIAPDTVWRYFKGTADPPATWKNIGFADGSWLSGATGIGYGDLDDATELLDMQEVLPGQPGYMSIFCRKTFTVANTATIESLILQLTIDDGFYAYLNGTLVASNNVTDTGFDAPAGGAIEPTLSEYDITANKNVLVNGTNVLAVQVHNAGKGSSDLSFIPRLINRTTVAGGGGTQHIVNGTWDTSATGYRYEGTHIRSGRTTQNPITGTGSLKILASGRGDNKVNRIETADSGVSAITANLNATISFKARWIVGAQTLLTNGNDHEMARAHNLGIPPNPGTPGARNFVTQRQAGGNLGPVITNVVQTPVVPGASEAVTVRARITDLDGVGSVAIRWSLDNPAASPATVAMTLVDENTYQGIIPGQNMGAKVVFFITAADLGGRQARYPVDVTTRTHPLLLNPPTATLNDHRYLLYRHDTRNPATNFQNYRFVMTETNETTLGNRLRLSNDLVDGSFIFGGETMYYESHTRFSGSPWARGVFGSMRVVMPRDEPLHGAFERFVLEDHHGNPANANERISHYLARQNQGAISVPYSDNFLLTRWQLNEQGGVTREHVWAPDNDFIKRWFPGDDEGDFLEMDDRFLIDDAGNRTNSADGRVLHPPPYGTNDTNGTNEENYRWFFNLRAKNGADEFSNFMAFARVMDPNTTNNTTFDQIIWDHANVEQMLRIWAIELNIDDWDTWGANRGKNCYFYRPDQTQLQHLLMWDLELTYGNVDAFLIPPSPSDTYNAGGFAEVNRLLNRPKIKRMYYSILNEMVNGPGAWFTSAYLNDYAQRLSAFGMANTGIAGPGGFIDQRRDRIRTRIQAAISPQVNLAVTAPANNSTVATPTFNASGTAPADVCEFLVDHDGIVETYPVTYSSMTNWSIQTIGLNPGLNIFTFIGLDLRGNTVDSATLRITSTAAWNTPAITTLTPDESEAGTDIQIDGSDFHNGARVFFGAVQSTTVTVNETLQRITARVPAGTGTVNVTVRNLDNKTSNAMPFTYVIPPPMFIRGDANGDSLIDISDGIKILRHLFSGVTTNCQDALDANDDEALNVTDAVHVLDFVFQGGPAPGAPFPDEGEDPSGSALGCSR